MSDINILVAIDADTIMQDYPGGGGSVSSPKWLDANKYFYMVVASGSAISGNAGGELNISAQIGDNIRWREESLSLNFNYSVSFASFRVSQGNTLMTLPPLLVGGVQGNNSVSEKKEPMPKQGSEPWTASIIETPYHFWQSTAESTGKVTYQWVFQIYDQNGNSKGYFGWDPFVTIVD